MILSLYLTIVCLCLSFTINDDSAMSMIVCIIGGVFYLIAEVCYRITINTLMKDIKKLKQEIDSLKE